MSRARTPPSCTVPLVALTLGTALLGGACSSSGSSGSAPGGAALPPATDAPTTTVPAGLPAVAPASCDAAVLVVPVRAQRPDAELRDIVCERPFAMATIGGASATEERQAAMLRFGRDGWAVVVIGPVPAGQPAPAGFSTATISRWQAQFVVPPPTEAPTVPAPGDPAPEEPVPAAACATEGPAVQCDAPPEAG